MRTATSVDGLNLFFGNKTAIHIDRIFRDLDERLIKI